MMFGNKKLSIVLGLVLVGLWIVRWISMATLQPSLGLDAIYLQTVDIYETLEKDPIVPPFQPALDPLLPLHGWPDPSLTDTPPDHVGLFSGKLALTVTDYEILPRGTTLTKEVSNPLSFKRYFHSQSNRFISSLGYGWRPSWDIRLTLIEDYYIFSMPDGNNQVFEFQSQANNYIALRWNADPYTMEYDNQQVTLTHPAGLQYLFHQRENSPHFDLMAIHHTNGVVYELVRDAENIIQAIRESVSNRETRFTYNSSHGLLAQAIFPSGFTLHFKYDDHLNLTQVQAEQGPYTRVYAYTDEAKPHFLTGRGDDQIREKFSYHGEALQGVHSTPFGGWQIQRDHILGRIELTLMNKSRISFVQTGDGKLDIQGPLGFKKQFFFNDRGQPIKIVDARGHVSQLTWNHQGDLVQKERGKAITNYEYNGKHQITRELGALGSITEYQWEDGLLQSLKHPNGDKVKWTYQGRMLESISDPVFQAERYYHFDPSGNLVSLVQPNQSQITFSYNKDGYPLSKSLLGNWQENYTWQGPFLSQLAYQEPDAQTRRVADFEYNASGNIVRQSDIHDKETRYTYDNLGRCIEIILPNQQKHKLSWSGSGRLLSWQTPQEVETTYAYDALDRLTQVQRNGQALWEMDYGQTDPGASLKTPAIPNSLMPETLKYFDGSEFQFTYDSHNRIQAMTHNQGQVIQYAYDARGNIISSEKSGALKTLYSYDAAHHLESLYQPDIDRVILLSHNRLGQLKSLTTPDLRTYNFQYNVSGRPLMLQKNYGPPLLSWNWDAFSNLTSIQGYSGRRTRYFYNPAGFKLAEQDAYAGKREWNYNRFQERSFDFDESGKALRWNYYPDGRMHERNHENSGLQYTWTYDIHNRIKKVSGVADYQLEWTDLSNLSKISFDKTTALLYQYNSLETNFRKKTYPGLLVQSFDYSESGQVTKISENNLDPILFNYDTAGRVQSITYPNGLVTEKTYDSLGRTTKITTISESGEPVFNRKYTYDSLDRVTEVTSERGALKTTYDPEGRVQEMSWDDSRKTSFKRSYNADSSIKKIKKKTQKTSTHYDYHYEEGTGRLLRVTSDNAAKITPSSTEPHRVHLHGRVDENAGFLEINKQVVQISGNRFTVSNVDLKPGENRIRMHAVDAAGRESHITLKIHFDPAAHASYTYDANGRIIFISKEGHNSSLQYDDEGRLSTVLSERGNKLHISRYQYYANGLPAYQENYVDGDAKSRNPIRLIFDEKENIIGILPAEGTGYQSLYFYSPEGDLLYRIDRGHKKYYYHLDKDGSVIGITNAKGEVLASYSYDALGQHAHTQEKIENPFRYLGHFYDSRIQTYFFKDFSGSIDAHAAKFGERHLFPIHGSPQDVTQMLWPFYEGPRVEPQQALTLMGDLHQAPLPIVPAAGECLSLQGWPVRNYLQSHSTE